MAQRLLQHRHWGRTLYTICCLFTELLLSNIGDTTSMLTCRPSPYVSVMDTRSVSKASMIFSYSTFIKVFP